MLQVRAEGEGVVRVATHWASVPAWEAWSASELARRQHLPTGVYQYVPKKGEARGRGVGRVSVLSHARRIRGGTPRTGVGGEHVARRWWCSASARCQNKLGCTAGHLQTALPLLLLLFRR